MARSVPLGVFQSIAVAGLLLAGPTTAQTTPQPLLSDPAADVAVLLPAGAAPLPQGVLDNIDLRELRIAEDLGNVTLSVIVQNAEPQNKVDGPRFTVGFRHQSTEFRLRAFFGPAAANSEGIVVLQRRPVGGTEWDPGSNVGGTNLDPSLPGVAVRLDKAWLADQDGTPPIPGRSLDQFWVESRDFATTVAVVGPGPAVSQFVPITDRMPDQGVGEVPYLVQLGQRQAGSAQLGSPQPNRASNGEETTFLFLVNVTNRDVARHTYAIAAEGAPENWKVTVPYPVVALAAGERRTVPVVVATPFAHQHDRRQEFRVVASEVSNLDDRSALTLGVSYLAVPQPAGHHPVVVLHSRGSPTVPDGPVAEGDGVGLYMNTQLDDGNDTGLTARARGGPSSSPGTSSYYWCARLEPTLGLGLDFDVARPGLGRFTVASAVPLQGTLTGSLVVAEPAEAGRGDFAVCTDQRLAFEVARVAPIAVTLGGGDVVAEPEILALADREFQPFVEGRDLYLELRIELERPAGPTLLDAPVLRPGASMRLPLQEYHDPVPAMPEGGAPRLAVRGEMNVLRNPGAVAVATLDVTPLPGQALDVSIAGTRTGWASLFTGELRRGVAATALLAVEVPANATDGDIANLLVLATDRDRPDQVSFARFVVEVDVDGEHADDRAALDRFEGAAAKSSPAPSLLVAVGLVAAVAALRRRG